MPAPPAKLLITADDYGLRPSYDEGILEAAVAGALDAVSVMVLRDPDPAPLLEIEVEVGLHLEARGLDAQLERFEELFGRPPTHVDGHHHCHAQGGRPTLAVARLGRRLGIRVRSVSPRHRRLLRCLGVATPDRLIGRLTESEAALPPEIEALLAGETPSPGTTEWMVHPGRSDPGAASEYDAGREEDLRLLLELASDPRVRRLRELGRWP